MLGLAERGAVVRALEGLAVEVHCRLEPRRVIGTFPNARVRRQVEAAPLRQLLQLVLVHFFLLRGNGRRRQIGSGRNRSFIAGKFVSPARRMGFRVCLMQK